ncbi:MAG: 4Fe-4S dicluster domain-containing protein [Nitrospirae bacterium]|nr:4Fe-4S dicluster domain-containing protein [Nitrospirota bacterium]
MSKHNFIYQDMDRCIGCYACEVHCKTEKSLPAGPRLCRIIPTKPKISGGIPKVDFVFMSCYQCAKPACVVACPEKAMEKRAKDGIVFVEQSLCTGCKACIKACPWGSPQFNEDTGTVVKCDHCMDRLDRGLRPACVSKCTTGSLHWTTPNEASQLKRIKHVRAKSR